MSNVNKYAFVPSRVDGLPSVTEVRVDPDRIGFLSEGQWIEFTFKDMCFGTGPLWIDRWIVWLWNRRCMKFKADREFCRADRQFRFYTRPMITVVMPDESPELAFLRFRAIDEMMSRGGWSTFDFS